MFLNWTIFSLEWHARNVDGSQPFSVLVNEQVSNLLPPKLTSQINVGRNLGVGVFSTL